MHAYMLRDCCLSFYATHTHTHTHAHTRAHAHAHTHTHTHINANSFVNKQIHTYTSTHAHTQTPAHTDTARETHTDTQTDTQTHTHTHTHTHCDKPHAVNNLMMPNFTCICLFCYSRIQSLSFHPALCCSFFIPLFLSLSLCYPLFFTLVLSLFIWQYAFLCHRSNTHTHKSTTRMAPY